MDTAEAYAADPSEYSKWYRKGYRASVRPNHKDLGHYDDLHSNATKAQYTAFLDGWDDGANGEPNPDHVGSSGKWGKI